jgi:hypothetical protein
MDISDSRDGTPTYDGNNDHESSAGNNHHGGGGNGGGVGGGGVVSVGNNHHVNHSSLSAALPPMASHPQNNFTNSSSSIPSSVVVSTQDALKTIQTALLLTSGSVNHTAAAVAAVAGHGSISSVCESPAVTTRSPSIGRATPTHSELESLNSAAAALQHQQNLVNSNSHSHQQHQHSSLSMVSSSPLTALKSHMISLTPSLSKLYKDSLIGHVVGWPAEGVERASQRVNEDHNSISNLLITKVSAELKMARSLVRLAEIQATLQEQRILFLRQQSLDLQMMGTTKPNFVSSSSAYVQQQHHHHHHHHTEPNTPTRTSASPPGLLTQMSAPASTNSQQPSSHSHQLPPPLAHTLPQATANSHL